ncbi:YHS domain-containing (seleno)protein [uncultured Polaribacter sp.]|uniref:YHS domain-containing (seleno)protein n=1 Tax=uncultured Polaribacter sp. TaxID=174711 RepID=UPI002635F486|nr:YHS domain-containing (seleno)protein [uncultured Polaribacter sp.]
MKFFFSILFLVISTSIFSQKTNYNTKKGYIAEGYDVVAYFKNKAEKGKKEFSTTFDNVKFKFLSKENLAIFKKNPHKYIPQYGGFCAYAIGKTGKKVKINPETFEIRDNKLYLFYNSWGTNTLELWNKEGAEKLKEKADQNWTKNNK